MGWVIAEPGMIRMLTLAKQCTDLSSGMFPQAVAAMLLESDLEARHIPEIVDLYRARRDALCAAAAEHLGDWFEWDVPPGGMFVWMRAKHPDMDTNELYRHALAENVAFVPSSVFDPEGSLRSAMRVNFTRNPPEILTEGVRRLRRAVERYRAR